MAQTKTKPRKNNQTSTNGTPPSPSAEVFTLAEAAAYLRFTEADILQLVEKQSLPGRNVGTDWRFLKSAIQDWLQTPVKPEEANRRKSK